MAQFIKEVVEGGALDWLLCVEEACLQESGLLSLGTHKAPDARDHKHSKLETTVN